MVTSPSHVFSILVRRVSVPLAVATILCASSQASAELIRWGPDGNNNGNFKTTGTDVPGNTLSINPNVNVVQQSGDDYALGSGAETTNLYASGTAQKWQDDDINLDEAQNNTDEDHAISDNQYLNYIIEAPSVPMTITDVWWDFWLNGSGAPHEFGIYVGIDGATPTQVGSDFNFNPGTQSGVDGNGDPNELLTASATGLNLQATAGQDVEFRLYYWGASSIAGHFHTTGAGADGAAVPEPSSLALIGSFGVVLVLACAWQHRRARRGGTHAMCSS